MHPLVFLLFGISIGAIGSFLGIGGGTIAVPVLYFIMGLEIHEAIALSTAMVFLTSISGGIAHKRAGNLDFRTSVLVSSPGLLTVILTSYSFPRMNPWILELAIGSCLLIASLRMFRQAISEKIGEKATFKRIDGKKAIALKLVLGLVVGGVVGMTGTGGGFVLVPAFTLLLGMEVRKAVGTSLVSFMPLAFFSTLAKLSQGFLNLSYALPLGIGVVMGAQLGARAVEIAKPWMIKLIFSLLLMGISLRLLLP